MPSSTFKSPLSPPSSPKKKVTFDQSVSKLHRITHGKEGIVATEAEINLECVKLYLDENFNKDMLSDEHLMTQLNKIKPGWREPYLEQAVQNLREKKNNSSTPRTPAALPELNIGITSPRSAGTRATLFTPSPTHTQEMKKLSPTHCAANYAVKKVASPTLYQPEPISSPAKKVPEPASAYQERWLYRRRLMGIC
jgi:hypothetical protein